MFAPQHKTSILTSVSVIALVAAISFATPNASFAKDFGSKFSSRSSSIAKRVRPIVRHRVRAPSRAAKARGVRRTGGKTIRATSTSRFGINTSRVKSSISKRLSGRTKTTSKLSRRLRVRNLKGRVANKPRRPRSRPSSAIAKKLATTQNSVSKRIKRLRTRTLKQGRATVAKKPTRKENESVRIEWSAVPVLVKKEIVATQRPATAQYNIPTVQKNFEMKTQAVAKLPTFAPQKKIDIKTEAFAPRTLLDADTVKSRTSTPKDTGFVPTGFGSALLGTDVANVNAVPNVPGGLNQDLISKLRDIKDSRIANVPQVLAMPGVQGTDQFSLLPSGEHNRPDRLENLLNGFGLSAGRHQGEGYFRPSHTIPGGGIIGGLPTPKQSSATDGSYVSDSGNDTYEYTFLLNGNVIETTNTANGGLRNTEYRPDGSMRNMLLLSPDRGTMTMIKNDDETNETTIVSGPVDPEPTGPVTPETPPPPSDDTTSPVVCFDGCIEPRTSNDLGQSGPRDVLHREQTSQPSPHENPDVQIDEQTAWMLSGTGANRGGNGGNVDCYAADCNDDGTGISTTHGSSGGVSGPTALQMYFSSIQGPEHE